MAVTQHDGFVCLMDENPEVEAFIWGTVPFGSPYTLENLLTNGTNVKAKLTYSPAGGGKGYATENVDPSEVGILEYEYLEKVDYNDPNPRN